MFKSFTSMSMTSTLLNIVFFQAIWFGCILLGNLFLPVAVLIVGIHFTLNKSRGIDIRLMLLAAIIGLIVDSVLLSAGVFEFEYGQVTSFIIPPWLVMLWLGFAMTINHSLKYFQSKPVWAFIGGAISGPLSYLAGVKFGAITLGYSYTITFIVFSAVWGPLFLGLTQYAKYLNDCSDHVDTDKCIAPDSH